MGATCSFSGKASVVYGAYGSFVGSFTGLACAVHVIDKNRDREYTVDVGL